MLNTVLKQLKSHPAVSTSKLILMMLMSVNDENSGVTFADTSSARGMMHFI